MDIIVSNKTENLTIGVHNEQFKKGVSLEQIESTNSNSDNSCDVGFSSNVNGTNKKLGEKDDNSTVQYYKFLLYSLKFEIKAYEFMNLIRVSTTGEIFFWVLNILTTFLLPLAENENYSTLVLFQIFHIFRAGIGIVLLIRLPRTYDLLENINKDLREEDLRTKSYQDILKDLGRENVISSLEKNEAFLLIYLLLSFFVMAIDIGGIFFIFGKSGNSNLISSVAALFITFILVGMLFSY